MSQCELGGLHFAESARKHTRATEFVLCDFKGVKRLPGVPDIYITLSPVITPFFITFEASIEKLPLFFVVPFVCHVDAVF